MYFGKHKGKPVEQVDSQYLLWCVDNIKKCPPPIMQVLDFRCELRYSTPTGHKNVLRYLNRTSEVKREFEPVTGEHADRLHAEFLEMGGDPDSCPFDTEDYTAPGPRITWDDDYPVMNHVSEPLFEEYAAALFGGRLIYEGGFS